MPNKTKPEQKGLEERVEVDSKNQRAKIKIVGKRKRSKGKFRKLPLQTRVLSDVPSGRRNNMRIFLGLMGTSRLSKPHVAKHLAEQGVLR